MLAKYKYKGRHRSASESHPVRMVTASLAASVVALLAAQAPAFAAGDPTWDRLAQCESSGNWAINTGNGFSGGLQFTPSTWKAYGGTGLAHNASRSEQIAVAQRVQAGQGWGAWPACSRKLGLSGTVAVSVPRHAAPVRIKRHVVAPVKPIITARHATPAKPTVGRHRAVGGSYLVVQGDTLSKIARDHHVTGGWRAIYKKNTGMGDPDVIFPLERITL